MVKFEGDYLKSAFESGSHQLQVSERVSQQQEHVFG